MQQLEQPQPSADTRSVAPTLTFRGGGWVIVLSALLTLCVLFWGLLAPLLGVRPVGDGHSVASYGFDLTNLQIASDRLVASGFPRGFLPSLDNPKHLDGRQMANYNIENRPKYVVSTDRVVAAVINGQAHAWPLTLLNAHEVVNDTVAGVPLVVTYSPLCDAALVFDRRVGGVQRLFEVSGLLVDSNLVFTDKSIDGTAADTTHVPSLFLQLERRAIAGPLASSKTTLSMLPGVCITTWADWLALHPDTTVTLRDPERIRHMKEISYARYFLDKELLAPVSKLPDEAKMEKQGLRLKSPVLMVESGDAWHAISLEALLEAPLEAHLEAHLESPVARGDASGPTETRTTAFQIGGTAFTAALPKGPVVCRVTRADGSPVPVIPCLYFSAHALLGVDAVESLGLPAGKPAGP
ncbi:MAG: DUF3179 domain-containing (seleno)protein [Limnohabitans sp.]|nr:DUF3179 domain-containing (seleno)protein [Limnohabitans sp.]